MHVSPVAIAKPLLPPPELVHRECHVHHPIPEQAETLDHSVTMHQVKIQHHKYVHQADSGANHSATNNRKALWHYRTYETPKLVATYSSDGTEETSLEAIGEG